MTHDPRASDAVDPVRVDGVSVTLGGTRVLDDVDLTVCPGEAVALLGANGSGKSTLVRALLGQVPLGAGAAWLFGAPTRDAGKVPWERIGYVPQRISAASGVPATALEVVQTGLLGRRRWWLGRSDRARAREALAELDVADLADRPFHVLSGGQQQRVVIARALVREPDLLVMDEPLAGVDLLTQTSFARLLRERHDQGTALVLVLHELGPFADLLDRAVVLRGGQVVHDGDLPRDHGHPEHPHHDHLHTDHGRPAEPTFPGSLP